MVQPQRATSIWHFAEDRVIPPSRRQLTRKEKMTLSPIRMYMKYGKFPWELTVHLLIVALSVSYIILHNHEFSAYVNANERSIRQALLNSDVGPLGKTRISTVKGLVTQITNATANYFEYPMTNIGEVTIEDEVQLQISYWNGSKISYTLTKDNPAGPFARFPQGSPEQRTFVNLLQSMSAVYILSNRLDATKSSSGPFYSLQFRWSCSGEYDFSDDSETTYTVRISSTVPSAKIPSLYALDTALIVLCSASIGLSMLNLYKSYQVYAYAKRRLELEPEDGSDNTLMWSSVHLRDKVAFFNLWHTWLIAGNLALIIAAIQSVVPGTEDLDRAHRDLNSQQLARSLGTFFALFSVVKYMEHYLEFYMLVIAVRSSFVRVVKFVLMIMPFYMGYCVVGLLVFYTEEDLFGTLWQTSRTLFALVNGDSILLVYQTLCLNADYGYCAFAQVYLYTFCIIFIVVVLNIFIFIISSGYEKAQHSTGNDFEDYVELDHDRVCKLLDAADNRSGLHLSGVPLRDTVGGGSTNSFHDDYVASVGIAAHPRDAEALRMQKFDERMEQIVRTALAAHMQEVSPEAASLKQQLDKEREMNDSLREALEAEYSEELSTVVAENKALKEQLDRARKLAVPPPAGGSATYE